MKKLEEVLTLSVMKKMVSQDPNLPLGFEDQITETSLLEVYDIIRKLRIESTIIEMLDGRDLDKEPLAFKDFGLYKKQ